MDNFRFKIPTEIIFGKGTHLEVGKEVKKYTNRVLLVRLSKESLGRIGIYDDIIKSLKDNKVSFIELDGIHPNPRLSKVQEGANICKKEDIDFILAVGGGSVIDTAKAIGAAACIDSDFWKIVEGKIPFEKSLSIGTILTIPATGTEMNTRCVITRDSDNAKKGISLAHPVFSILNPELCAKLPQNRVAQSVVDMLAHAMERYFTNTEAVELTDRMLEGVMKTIIDQGSKFYQNGYDYDTACQVMYSATVAHNFSLCVGRVNDFGSHAISHELSGEYDLPHGEALSIIFPAWIRYVRDHNKERMAQFFTNVFDVEKNPSNPDEVIDKGIIALENFYTDLNMPIKISQTDIKDCDVEKLAKRATNDDTVKIGNYVKLDMEDLIKIYEIAM